MSWGTHRKPFAHSQKVMNNRNIPSSAHLKKKKKVCQENSYLGPPRHFPGAKGWSLNICYNSADERLPSTLVCMFSHPISEGNVLIGWQSYLQDVLIRAASRYLASEAGDDVLGITPALCNQPGAAISTLLSPPARGGELLWAHSWSWPSQQLGRKDFVSHVQGRAVKRLALIRFSSLARLK